MNHLNIPEHCKKVVTFQAGDIIFEERTPGEIMYVLLDGEVEISALGRTIDVANSGDVIGEMALIDSKSRSATAIAKTDCSLASLDEKLFLSLIQETPLVALEVMRVLVDRLRRINAKG